jgi:hypothetical protein
MVCLGRAVQFWAVQGGELAKLGAGQAGSRQADHFIFFGHKNSLFGHNRYSTLFFPMKVAESEKSLAGAQWGLKT